MWGSPCPTFLGFQRTTPRQGVAKPRCPPSNARPSRASKTRMAQTSSCRGPRALSVGTHPCPTSRGRPPRWEEPPPDTGSSGKCTPSFPYLWLSCWPIRSGAMHLQATILPEEPSTLISETRQGPSGPRLMPENSSRGPCEIWRRWAFPAGWVNRDLKLLSPGLTVPRNAG